MLATREEMKVKAIELLNKMDVDSIFIERFKEFDKIPYFDYKFPVLEEVPPLILRRIKQFEEERKCLVYAVTSDDMPFGKCFSFLCISPYEEDWRFMFNTDGVHYVVYAYVWNVTEDWRSESGSVLLVNRGSRLIRVG